MKARWRGRGTSAPVRLCLLLTAVAIASAPLEGVALAEDTSIAGVRSAAGLPPLTPHAALDQLAAGHARAMAANGSVSHLDLAVANAVVDRPARVGQIAGAGSSVAEVEATFLTSETHRANIVGDFDLVGVGLVVGADGRVWMSALFVKLAPPPPAPPSAPTVARASDQPRPSAAVAKKTAVRKKAPVKKRPPRWRARTVRSLRGAAR